MPCFYANMPFTIWRAFCEPRALLSPLCAGAPLAVDQNFENASADENFVSATFLVTPYDT